MNQPHRVLEPHPEGTFRYRRGSKFWWRYLLPVSGLGCVYAVLSYYGIRPFSGVAFPLLVGVVLLDAVVAGVLRARSPRVFHFDGEQVRIEWTKDVVSVPVNEMSTRRDLSWLLTSGSVFRAGGRTFPVFDDLEGFDDLVALCSARHTR